MKTVYVKYIAPEDVIGQTDGLSEKEIKQHCFRVIEYETELIALERYANTHATWSTLLEKGTNVDEFIDSAYEHIKHRDIDWLEKKISPNER